MSEAVKVIVNLDTPTKNGTKRQQYESLKKRFQAQGKTEEEIQALLPELVEIDDDLLPFLQMFFELSAGRQSGMSGPAALSYSEIKTYCDLMEITLTPTEVSALRQMDTTFLATMSALQEENK